MFSYNFTNNHTQKNNACPHAVTPCVRLLPVCIWYTVQVHVAAVGRQRNGEVLNWFLCTRSSRLSRLSADNIHWVACEECDIWVYLHSLEKHYRATQSLGISVCSLNIESRTDCWACSSTQEWVGSLCATPFYYLLLRFTFGVDTAKFHVFNIHEYHINPRNLSESKKKTLYGIDRRGY